MSQAERNSSQLEAPSMSKKTSTDETRERDLEAAKLPAANADEEDEETTPKDPNLVTWDGPQDPENPKNWPNKTKWRYAVAVSTFTFISPVSSAMIAPALSKLGEDLHMQSEIEVELALSIFILAYAVGPLFFGPASELYSAEDSWHRQRHLQQPRHEEVSMANQGVLSIGRANMHPDQPGKDRLLFTHRAGHHMEKDERRLFKPPGYSLSLKGPFTSQSAKQRSSFG